MKEKKEKKTTVKVKIKVDKIVAAYDLLNTRSNKRSGVIGFKLSGLDTKDMFKVINIIRVLKPIAEAFHDFQRDAGERLKPDNWDEILEKKERMDKLPPAEQAEVDNAIAEFNKKGAECVQAELDKEVELEPYEHLGKDAFGILVKDNGHLLDAFDILYLQEMLNGKSQD
ncbi:MAG: hypothetical protein K2G13_02360 [Muribaculaceae bacterium]|nr:hypothetical protein [Muribaculaceae bacterium]